MSTIILVRPGSTDFDAQKRIQGTLDLPLNGVGENQLQDILDKLAKADPAVIYTGPTDPARSTAEAIGGRLRARVKECDELRNLNCGLWQGLQLDEIRRKFPKVFKQWKESPESVRPPEGEGIAEAVRRIEQALHKPLKKKVSFVVVASEPLATLVSCVVKKAKPFLAESLDPKHEPALVEYLQGETPENGRRRGTEAVPVAAEEVPSVSNAVVT